ncbi:Hpt domain-containing protein [Maridesulfovibrio hydrothermalis]|uniref:HPt domain-containing protein n=1 Tax=Maridesulfovibrio hydrothermalis AM13 = DSM 14728 TaxID=1121451 RepID=L0REZ7_9BACT|nr:Hpt domain-containing protein [Maridesulfovibrio hydrothermalis]CCO25329.1 conserved protein of unknown function [Maridesulfovibrio hydrothermalis AM13 = DSM 14728]
MLGESTYIVKIDPDLIDLAPVLMESLNQELDKMMLHIDDANFEKIEELAHSSRGAALTFGFDAYARKLRQLKKTSLDKDVLETIIIFKELRLLLDNVEFI